MVVALQSLDLQAYHTVWYVMNLSHSLTRPLALGFRAWAQRRHQPGASAVLRVARATMRRKKYCLLTTVGDGGVSARVLQPFPPGPSLDVWFGTSASSRKVVELRADPRATLAYQDDGKSACVVLAGRIEVVEALEVRRSRFMPTWWAFWPDGPESADFILLHFVPHRLEVWDATRGITPEPFGLRAAHLVLRDGEWREG
jgi:general stress protein 26